MIIDLSGGSFDATNDFEVELGAGSGDRVVINGTGSADAFVFGLDGINLDGDGNADVMDKTAMISPNVPTEGEGFVVNAGGGSYSVPGAGGSGMGGA